MKKQLKHRIWTLDPETPERVGDLCPQTVSTRNAPKQGVWISGSTTPIPPKNGTSKVYTKPPHFATVSKNAQKHGLKRKVRRNAERCAYLTFRDRRRKRRKSFILSHLSSEPHVHGTTIKWVHKTLIWGPNSIPTDICSEVTFWPIFGSLLVISGPIF